MKSNYSENEIQLLLQILEEKHYKVIETMELNNKTHLKDEESKCQEDSNKNIKEIINKIRKFKTEVKEKKHQQIIIDNRTKHKTRLKDLVSQIDMFGDPVKQ